MTICFTDDNIKKLYKSINVTCTKNSFPLLRRLSNNYLNYYLKNSAMISKQFNLPKIDKNTIALVKKMNHETNVYHHTYKVERLFNLSSELKQANSSSKQTRAKTAKTPTKQKGGSREDYSYPNIDLNRAHIGGGTSKSTTSSIKGFDKQCETIMNQMEYKSLPLTKDAKKYLHTLTENFLMKLALNAVSLNKEVNKSKSTKISRIDIVNALP